MAFPANPITGTTHGINDRAWLFNGYAWERYDTAPNEVYTINGITGNIGLSAGTDISISLSGKTFTISSPTLYGVSGAIYASNLATGLLHGGIISINAGNSAAFDITAGRGQIHASGSTYTADPLPTLQYVNWSAQSGITLNYLATSDTTWIYIDNAGTVHQRTEYYTDDLLETSIIIGQLVHPSRTYINLARTNPNVAYATDKQYEQFIRAFGPIKISGHTISPNGANLKLNRTSGKAFSLGRNWINNTDDPSVVSDGAYTDCIFYRYYRGATAGTFITVPNQTVIDPTKIDNGTGILATVPGGKYTIQRLFYYPNTPTLLGVYYGRAQYTSLADAAANINLEEFTEIENTRTNAIFVAYLIVKSGTTDLTNASDALILQAGSFRSTTSGGGSVSLTLDDLTDVIISSPQNYQVLTYVDGLTGWENKSVSVLPLVSSFNGLTGAITGVGSLAGTTNQITVSGATGAVTLSLPSTVTVPGALNVTTNLTVTGNLTVNGTSTTVNSDVMTVDDPIIILGTSGGVPISVSDGGKDRGIAFNYYDTAGRTGFFGYDASENKFVFMYRATVANDVATGLSFGNVLMGRDLSLRDSTGFSSIIRSGGSPNIHTLNSSFDGELVSAGTYPTANGYILRSNESLGFPTQPTWINPNAAGFTAYATTNAVITNTNSSATWYPTFVGGTGATAFYIDAVSTPLSYQPSSGTINSRTFNGTFSTNIAKLDANGPTIFVDDGTDAVSVDTSSLTKTGISLFTFSSPGIVLESSINAGITFTDVVATPSWGYMFPRSNGTNGQVLTTNGAGTLTWENAVLVSFASSDVSLANVNTAQNVFTSASDTVALKANTTYIMKGQYIIQSGTTTHTTAVSFLYAGGVTASMSFSSLNLAAAVGTVSRAQDMVHFDSISGGIINSTSTSARNTIVLEGMVKTNASTGCTLTPQITFSAAPGGTNLTKFGSYISFTPIGTSTATSIGPWS